MDTIKAIEARRAVKHYDPDFTMPEDDKQKFRHLLRQAPTSFNIQNWRVVDVKDRDLRAKIRAAAWDQAQVTDASLLYVICADVKAYEKAPERYWSDAPQDVQDMMAPMIMEFYKGREWMQRDEAMRSAGIAAQTLMLAAKAMGYDSSPMIGFDVDAVGKLINLPADHVVCMMLAIGKGIMPARPKGGYIDDSEVFLDNHF